MMDSGQQRVDASGRPFIRAGEMPYATAGFIRVGWRGFEGWGRPFEGWWYDGYRWRHAPRRFTRRGALWAAWEAAREFEAARLRENEAAPDRIVARAQAGAAFDKGESARAAATPGPELEPWDPTKAPLHPASCDGSSSCPADVHVAGCFAGMPDA